MTEAECQIDSISFIHAATPILAPVKLDAPSSSNLAFLCIEKLGSGPFGENYAKLYFDVKHLEKGLNKGW